MKDKKQSIEILGAVIVINLVTIIWIMLAIFFLMFGLTGCAQPKQPETTRVLARISYVPKEANNAKS